MSIRYKAITKAKEILEPMYSQGFVAERLGEELRKLVNSIEDTYMRVAVATVISTGRFTIGYDPFTDEEGNEYHVLQWHLMMPTTKECIERFMYVARCYKNELFFGIYDY